MDESMYRKMEEMKSSATMAMFTSKKAIKCIVPDDDDKINELAGIAYINKAMCYMCIVQSIYFSNIEVLEHDDIENVINLFDIFSTEYIENFATNHSHQWSCIEFNRYEEAFNDSVLAMSIK